MSTFVLCHRHEPTECRFVFAAWRGFDSPLRHGRALASCGVRDPAAPGGRHTIYWTVEATDAQTALDYLPAYLLSRTEVVSVTEVPIP